MSLSGKFLAGSDGPFLRQKVKDLIDAGTKMMVIDFADVPYIDSTGLGFLAGSRVTAQNAGVSLVLSSINQHVKRILDGVRLTPFFVLADDETSGVAKAGEGLVAAQGTDAGAGKGARKKRPAASGD